MHLRDAALDLVLGGACCGCGAPGRLLCEACLASVPRRAHVVTPSRTSEVPAFALLPYTGLGRALVLTLKEQRAVSLVRPMARMLATVVRDALASLDVPRDAEVRLVPVPSRAAAVRERGLDSTWALTRAVARELAPQRRVRAHRLLVTHAQDQAGLGRRERASNAHGSMQVRGSVRPSSVTLLIDDVITSGATLREAIRTIRTTGTEISAVACLAATPRRTVATREPVPSPQRF